MSCKTLIKNAQSFVPLFIINQSAWRTWKETYNASHHDLKRKNSAVNVKHTQRGKDGFVSWRCGFIWLRVNRRSHNTELLGLRRRRRRRRPQLLLLNCSFQFISLPFSSELTFYNKHFNTAERFQKDITKTKLVNVVEKWLLILPSYFPSSNLLLLRLCVLFWRLFKAMVVSIENC